MGFRNPQVLGTETKSLHSKVLQVEAAVSVLVQDKKNSRFNLIHGEIPTSLFALESTTARNTAAALHKVMGSIFDMRDMATQFPMAIRHTCSDMYSANVAAERLLTGAYPEMVFCHLFCAVHRLFTVTTTAMSPADPDVGGLLNAALATGRPGSVTALRRALAKILTSRLIIRFEDPPVDEESRPLQR